MELTSLQQIVNKVGLPLTFVKAIAGLSRPVRAALRLQLTGLKTSLQGELATFAFKSKIMRKKQSIINNLFSAANAELSQIKRVLNLLNFGPEFNDEPEVQKLIDTLMSAARIKGISLGGYKDADNILSALNFKAQQTAKSIDFVDNAVMTINHKINLIDNYIAVLDAIDTLRQH